MFGYEVEYSLHQNLRNGCAGGKPNGFNPFEPFGFDLMGVIHKVTCGRTILQRNLHQTLRVRAILRANNDHQIALGRDCFDCHLAVLGGVANVVARRILQVRELLLEQLHDGHGLVDRQGGL